MSWLFGPISTGVDFWFPVLVAIDGGLALWTSCFKLWVRVLLFIYGLAIVHLYIQSFRGLHALHSSRNLWYSLMQEHLIGPYLPKWGLPWPGFPTKEQPRKADGSAGNWRPVFYSICFSSCWFCTKVTWLEGVPCRPLGELLLRPLMLILIPSLAIFEGLSLLLLWASIWTWGIVITTPWRGETIERMC